MVGQAGRGRETISECEKEGDLEHEWRDWASSILRKEKGLCLSRSISFVEER